MRGSIAQSNQVAPFRPLIHQRHFLRTAAGRRRYSSVPTAEQWMSILDGTTILNHFVKAVLVRIVQPWIGIHFLFAIREAAHVDRVAGQQ